MSDNFELPEVLDASPETVAQAEATMDPEVYAPDHARVDADKKDPNKVYRRWAENLIIEVASRRKTPKGLTEYYIQARIRPNDDKKNKNVGKRIFTRYYVNYKVMSGAVDNPAHARMNTTSYAALLTLLKAVGLVPTNIREEGLKAALLIQLFPADIEAHDSDLTGKMAVGNILDRPNTGDYAKKRPSRKIFQHRNEILIGDRDIQVEDWLPLPDGVSK